MPPRRWRIRLSAEAARDFAGLVRWTAERFGARQATLYQDVLTATLAVLAEGPDVPGSAARDEILPGLRTLHVARAGRRGRHFVVFRAAAQGGVIEVVRILHDGMELGRHVPPE